MKPVKSESLVEEPFKISSVSQIHEEYAVDYWGVDTDTGYILHREIFLPEA